MKDIIGSMEGYKIYEKLILLCSRADQSEEVDEYIQSLILDSMMNWDMFLGVLLNNRVNGVVYKKLIQYKGIPKYVIYYLRTIYEEQVMKGERHIQEIQIINKALREAHIHYAFLKGAYMNTFVYKVGERSSNDTDIMVWPEDLNKCGKVLEDMGYRQGYIKDGEFKAATRNDIIFAKMNTYEIVPYIKIMEDSYLPYHVIDINFKLSNDEKKGVSKRILDTVQDVERGKYSLRIMRDENFLLYLCIHLYREATMVLQIMSGTDLTLYKFMDVHFFILDREDSLDWDLMFEEAEILGRLNDIYYTLYYTEELYPGTVCKKNLEKFKPESTDFLNEYKGRDNTKEVYKWNLNFKERVLNSERKLEAMPNISEEYKRYHNILDKLKKDDNITLS